MSVSLDEVVGRFRKISSREKKIAFACTTIQDFRNDSLDPIIADKFLAEILPFMEKNSVLTNQNDEWIGALIGIAQDHASLYNPENTEEYSFSYHDSYEKALFAILSMVETTSALTFFMKAMKRLSLTNALVDSFGVTLVNDISYHSQEIALDILCRMATYCLKSPEKDEVIGLMDQLLATMPLVIKDALINPLVGPKGMLVDMRPYLNEINRENKNVKSFPITAFGIEVAGLLPYTRRISGPSWLDLSKENLSIYVPEKDMLIKFSYHLIVRIHFVQNSGSKNTMQIKLERSPDNMEGLLQSDEVAFKRNDFYVDFGNRETMDRAEAAFSSRLETAEKMIIDPQESRSKFSIISSRNKSPQDLKEAIQRFTQAKLDIDDDRVVNSTSAGTTSRVKDKILPIPQTVAPYLGDDKADLTANAVVTASKSEKKPIAIKGRKMPITSQLNYGHEETLTAITSPESGPVEEEEDKDDGRHAHHQASSDQKSVTKGRRKSIKQTEAKENAVKVIPSSVSTSSEENDQKKSKLKSKTNLSSTEDSGVPVTSLNQVKAGSPETRSSTKDIRQGEENSKSSSASNLKAIVKGKGKVIPKVINDPKIITKRGRIAEVEKVVPATLKTRRLSTSANAPQDILNTPRNDKIKNDAGTKNNKDKVRAISDFVGDENKDPSLVNSQPTSVQIRRTNFKSRSSTPSLEKTAPISIKEKATAAVADSSPENSQPTPSRSRRTNFKARSSLSSIEPAPILMKSINTKVSAVTSAAKRVSQMNLKSVSTPTNLKEKESIDKVKIGSAKPGLKRKGESRDEKENEEHHEPSTTTDGSLAKKARMRSKSDDEKEQVKELFRQHKKKVKPVEPQPTKDELEDNDNYGADDYGADDYGAADDSMVVDQVIQDVGEKEKEDEEEEEEEVEEKVKDLEPKKRYIDNLKKKKDPVEIFESAKTDERPPSPVGTQETLPTISSWRPCAIKSISPVPASDTFSSFPKENLSMTKIATGASKFSSLLATAVGSEEKKSKVKPSKELGAKEQVKKKQTKKSVKDEGADSDAEVQSDDDENRRKNKPSKTPSKYPSATSVYASSQEESQTQDTEVDPSASQENEEINDISKHTRGRTSSPVSSDGDGDGSDEDGVIAMLLEELVTMQKNRASRKRTRLMTNAVEAATSQVDSYLKNWSDFNETHCAEMHQLMTSKLEGICATADGVCNIMQQDVLKFDVESRELVAQMGLVEQELEALQQEVTTATALQKEDEATLKGQMLARKKTAIETAKKSLKEAKRGGGKASSSGDRMNTNKLMLALREL